MKREGFVGVARRTVECLIRKMSLRGVVRGKSHGITTFGSYSNPRPLDPANRVFHASRPNELRVADFNEVATLRGFVYVALVIDVFARMIVGWRAAASISGELTRDALEQAIWARQTRR